MLLAVRTMTLSAVSPSLLAMRARTCCCASAGRAETSGPNGVPSTVEVAASAVRQDAALRLQARTGDQLRRPGLEQLAQHEPVIGIRHRSLSEAPAPRTVHHARLAFCQVANGQPIPGWPGTTGT